MDGGTVDPDVFSRAFWLTRSVARVMGVNLSRAIATGQLTPQGYGEMVARCRAAGCEGKCECWLARQSSLADSPPEPCAHKSLLTRLRADQS